VIHLDTSFLIRALVRRSPEDLRLRKWLSEGTSVGIGAVAWAEFQCGPVDARQLPLAMRIIREPVPYLAEDAAFSARLFNLSGRRRGSLMDCMIAATAVRVEAALATANPGDFRRFEPAGLKVVSVS